MDSRQEFDLHIKVVLFGSDELDSDHIENEVRQVLHKHYNAEPPLYANVDASQMGECEACGEPALVSTLSDKVRCGACEEAASKEHSNA